MKRQVRQGVFETNSSSTHTLTLRIVENASKFDIIEMFDMLPQIVKEHIKENGLYFGRFEDEYCYCPFHYVHNKLEMPYPIEIMQFEDKLHTLISMVMCGDGYTAFKIEENIKYIADTLGVKYTLNLDAYEKSHRRCYSYNLIDHLLDVYNLASYILDVDSGFDNVPSGTENTEDKEGYTTIYTVVN